MTADSREGEGWLGRLRDAALLTLAVVTCVLAYRAFHGFIFEDAYITYRYADNLAGGRGFVFNPGERVLGTTTPLYTLILTGLGLLGLDIPSAGTALSVVAIAGVGLAGAWTLRRRAHPALGVVFALIALWGGFATYYLSGMETAFYSLLLLGSALAASRRSWGWTGVLIGLAFLTRYDAVMFAGPLLLLAWLGERARLAPGEWRAALRGPLRAALIAAALALPWLVFASFYFGSPLPNTLAAKQALLSTRVFLAESARMFPRHMIPPLSAPLKPEENWLNVSLALAFLAPIPFQLRALGREWKIALVFLLHPLCLWLGYGWIGASLCIWHVVPGFFSLSILALLAWGNALRRVRLRAWPTWVSLGLLGASLVLLPGNLRLQSHLIRSTDSYRTRERGYEEMASWMRARGLLDLVVCMDEPGYFTHLTDCRIVDRQGLITKGVRPGDDLLELTRTHGVQALFAPEELAGFVRAREVPRPLSIRADVVHERLGVFAQPWLEPARDPSATSAGPLASELDWDFEPGAEHGWYGRNQFIGRPQVLRAGAEPVRDAYLNTSQSVTGEWAVKLWSPPFRIEFDELTFWLGMGGQARANHGLRLQLLVNDLLVLEEAPAPNSGEMREVRWPVHAWRGMPASLRILDTSSRGWLALDHVRSVHKSKARVLDDFESAAFGPRWTETFAPAPLPYARTAEALGLAFILGRATASSLDVSGPARLLSAPFVVEHDELAFVVQGFGRPDARVELHVDGEVVRQFLPRAERALSAVVWDLTPFRGREAVLAAYDDEPDPARGIGLDAVTLFDRSE